MSGVLENIVWDAYPADDPVGGQRVGRLTDATDRWFRDELEGEGRGGFTINVNKAQATTAYLASGVLYRIYDLDLAPLVTLAFTDVSDDIEGAGSPIETASAHGLAVGDIVDFPSLTGGTGLSAAPTAAYWVVAVPSSTSFKVAASNIGSGINLTTDITAGTVRQLMSTADPKGGACLGGVFLEDGDFDALSENYEGGRDLTFTGYGLLSYFHNGAIPDVARSANAGPHDNEWLTADGSWLGAWGEGTTATGAIVRRLIYEAALQINEASGDQLWPQITQSTIMFGEDDSDSNATPIQSDPVFAPIGQDLLEGLQIPLRNGGLFLRLHPDLTQVFCYLRSAYGNDKTGTSFGAGVVRFQGDTNILVRAEGVPSAPRRSFKKTKAKYLIVGTGNDREIVTNPDPPAYNSYAGLNTDSEDSDDYSAIGTAEHVRRNAASDVVRFAAKTGTTPTSGFYTPRDDVDLGDLCTLDSGGSVDFDWDDSDMQLAAHEFRERDGGGFYWVPEFGAVYTSARAAAIAGAVGGVRSGDCKCLRLCSISLPGSGGTEYWSVDYASGDDSWTEPCGSTNANFTGPWTSALHSCSSMGGARHFDGIYTFAWIPASDDELTLQLRIARRGHEPGSNSIVYIEYNDGATCSIVGGLLMRR